MCVDCNLVIFHNVLYSDLLHVQIWRFGAQLQNMALKNSIIEILDKAQTSTVHHPKLLKSLKSLHDETDLVQFFEAFIQPLCAALVIVKKQPVVERVLEFVAKFSASTAPLEPSPREDEESELSDRSTIVISQLPFYCTSCFDRK